MPFNTAASPFEFEFEIDRLSTCVRWKEILKDKIRSGDNVSNANATERANQVWHYSLSKRPVPPFLSISFFPLRHFLIPSVTLPPSSPFIHTSSISISFIFSHPVVSDMLPMLSLSDAKEEVKEREFLLLSLILLCHYSLLSGDMKTHPEAWGLTGDKECQRGIV